MNEVLRIRPEQTMTLGELASKLETDSDFLGDFLRTHFARSLSTFLRKFPSSSLRQDSPRARSEDYWFRSRPDQAPTKYVGWGLNLPSLELSPVIPFDIDISNQKHDNGCLKGRIEESSIQGISLKNLQIGHLMTIFLICPSSMPSISFALQFPHNRLMVPAPFINGKTWPVKTVLVLGCGSRIIFSFLSKLRPTKPFSCPFHLFRGF